MAILKRRLKREKKSPETSPPAQADEAGSSGIPTADEQVSPAETPPSEAGLIPAGESGASEIHTEDGQVSPVEAPASGEIPAQTPTQSNNTATSPPAEPVQTDKVSPETPIQSTTPAAAPGQQDAEFKSSSIPIHSDSTNPSTQVKLKARKLSLMQKILIVVVSLSATLLAYSLVLSFMSTLRQANVVQPQPYVTENTQVSSPQADAAQSVSTGPGASAIQAAESAATSVEPAATGRTEPMSLKLAEGHYAAKDYVRAYIAYEQLHKNLTGQDFELMRNFLLLRMAMCLEKEDYFDKANKIFRSVSQSRSIALRAIANYHISLIEMNSGQYLKARTSAYKTIALTGALSPTYEWALTLERDSTFLAAEAITREVLALCDADKELPQEFLPRSKEKDLLTGLSETELQAVLNAGIELVNNGLLAPQVRAVESRSGLHGLNRWMVVCNGPGIDELMARFAANAALDVRWIRGSTELAKARTDEAISNEQQTNSWNRPVTLYLPAAAAQQVATIAAGAVGLLARIDDTGTITITNPTEYFDLSEHTRELSENAMRLWRMLLLTYSDDPRIPNIHFALGVLQDQRENLAQAIAEYKLVANRYPQTPLAPFALLRSSRIKTAIRDYSGASRDLKQLIEQYPDNALVGQAHLNLAETTMKAGHYDEACSLYRKAYSLGLSVESQTIAAFGAGSCFYQMNDYESAVKWLTRYLDAVRTQQHTEKTEAMPQPQNGTHKYTAYLLLGKANLALGNLPAACNALKQTVQRAATSDEYIEAISALVETQIKQQNFIAALGTVENVRAWPFSQEQVTRLLLLKSSILRAMGLADQAITVLTDKAQYLTDSQLKADIILELARCYVAAQNLDSARAYFTEVLSLAKPGPVAQQASLELADVCLKLGDYQQSISICMKLLETSACEKIKQGASKILASAYSRQREYDKAAEALLTASVLPDTTKLSTDKK